MSNYIRTSCSTFCASHLAQFLRAHTHKYLVFPPYNTTKSAFQVNIEAPSVVTWHVYLIMHALFPIYEYAHTKHIARHHLQKLILVKFPDPLTNTRRWKFAHNHRRDANQAPKTYTHTLTHSHANITRHTFERRCGHHHGRADD